MRLDCGTEESKKDAEMKDDQQSVTDGEAHSMVPKEPPPSMTISDELYKEVLLSMRYKL